MKWMQPKRVQFGDQRDREGFLFFPRTIDRETRWLERATWREIATSDLYDGGIKWHPLCWLHSASSKKAQLANSNAELCRGGKPS